MAARPAAATVWIRDWSIWYLLGLAALGVILYWNSLHGPFLFDDLDIREPRTSVRVQDWKAILLGPRPLLILSYALQYRLAGGQFREFDFHVLNLVLHILNAAILWLALRRLPGLPAAVVWAAPGLFLSSPIQTESVAYISSRSELLAATFYLLAILVFVSAWREQRPWITAGLVALCYGCSVTSKQHGLTLPGALLLLDYFFLAGRDWRRLKRNWPTYAVLAKLMVVGGAIVVRQVISAPSAGFNLKDVTWQDYLFTQFRMYWLYLRLLAVPFGLNADYDIQPSRTLLEHYSWLALAGLVALAGAALWIRNRLPVVSCGLLFFFLTLFPTSSFYPLLDYAAERRLYLPSIGFLLAALGLLAARWGGWRELAAGLVAVGVIYAAGTIHRNRVWADSLVLWQDTAAKSPRKWRAHANLGREYSDRGQFVQATEAYRTAVELAPPNPSDRVELLSSLGSTYANRGLHAEAVKVYEEALRLGQRSRLWTNLAMAQYRLGRPEAWENFEKAIELDPLAWEPHLSRGNIYYQLKRYDDAIRDYERVLQIIPDHPDAQYNLKAARAMKARTER
jgi:tetratricopeptide (TPR) repeat protein